MKKLVLFIVSLILVFGIKNTIVEAQSAVQEDYRPPIIGSYNITRLDCNGHNGEGRFLDISLGGDSDFGMPVYSSGNGHVTFAGNTAYGYGDNVVIEDGKVGFRYAHLTKIYVWEGKQVNRGDLIGLIGNTGGPQNGYHLHWDGWALPGYTFDLIQYIQQRGYISLNQYARGPGQACVAQENVGTITGPPRFQWNSCPEFYAQGLPDVYLFDDKFCRGNYAVLHGNQTFNLATTFNDRTRSIYIPPGKTIVASADVNNPMSLSICHTVDMWNVDSDHYDNSVILVGFDGSQDSNGYVDPNGYNMISSVTVLDNGACQYDPQAISAAAPGVLPSINTWDIGGGGSGGGAYGDSRIDIRKDTNYGSDQYGWDDPTNGWVNVPGNLNDQVSSVRVDSGYSLWVAKDTNGNGTRKCLVSDYPDLSGAYYDNGDPMTDTISSVWAFTDSTCGGNYLGTRPGDTVTFWENANFDWNNWGVHDPYSGSLMSNMISSIGVTPGWSAVVYEGPNLTGGFTCFFASDTYLTDNLFNNGYPAADNIESGEIFHDTNCGGRMHAPTVTTLSATVTNTSNGEVTITYNVSGASPGYSIHTEFGDNTNFDLQGPAVNTTATHNYAYGSYEIAVSVKGTDGIPYAYLIPITVSAPPPTYTLTTDSADTASGLVNFTLDWSNAANDWHHIDFGDGVQSFDVHGPSGHEAHSVIYNPGTFTLSFSVKGLDGQQYPTTQQIVMPEPSLSLTLDNVNAVTGLVNYTVVWANAAPGSWQIVDFGHDGANVGYQGSADTKVDSHYFNPGTYTMTFTVTGRNGLTYAVTQQVVVTGPPTATPVPAPTYSLTIDSVDQNSGLTTFTLDWNTAADDWHHIDFGDGQAFDVHGTTGHQQSTVIYQPGTWTMSFTVKGLNGQNYPTSQQVTVSGPPPTATPAPPTYSLTATVVDPATNLVEANATWSGAADDWQLLDWGDGSNVGYHGSSGTSIGNPNGYQHNYAAGTWTMTFTVKALNGQNYTVQQTVTVGS